MKHTPILFTLLFMAISASGCSADQNQGQEMVSLKVNQPAPDLAFTDLDGNPVKLSSYLGKVLLLNYWNLACQPCRDEFPEFERLYQDYREQGLAVVAIHWGGPASEVQEFVQEQGYTFDVLIAENVGNSPPLPTTYVIDQEGVVREYWLGGPMRYDWVLQKLVPYMGD
jgi:peroxiredoxin